ncbi:MAG: hypothetical protein ACRD8Z_00555 [Nitrososphaeraceae archaeon]
MARFINKFISTSTNWVAGENQGISRYERLGLLREDVLNAQQL